MFLQEAYMLFLNGNRETLEYHSIFTDVIFRPSGSTTLITSLGHHCVDTGPLQQISKYSSPFRLKLYHRKKTAPERLI